MKASTERSISLRRAGHGDSFASLVYLLLKNYRFIFVSSLVLCGIVAAYSFLFIPKTYVSETKIMSISADSSGIGGAIQGIMNSAGVGGLLGISGSGDETTRWQEILTGRELAGLVVDRMNLMESDRVKDRGLDLSDPEERYRARYGMSSKMMKGLNVSLDRAVLSVQFESESPEFSFKAVSAYLDALREFITENSLSQAHATEEFIEARLQSLREELTLAEASMVSLQKTSGVVELPSQSGLSLSQAADLRTQLIEKDMEISLYADILKDSAELQRKQSERQQLVNQLNKLFKGEPQKSGEIEVFTPLGKVPELQMAFATVERKYVTLSSLVGFLEQQLELARIETKKKQSVFQVIDKPVLPIKSSGPLVWLNALIAFVVGLMLSSFSVLFMNFIRNEFSWRDERIIKLNIKKHETKLRA